MFATELQSLKALLPILVTESEIVMLSKELQPWKAQLPICFTESGNGNLHQILAVPFMARSETFGKRPPGCLPQHATLRKTQCLFSAFSKQLPCKTSTFRIFWSTESPGNFSRSICFSCCTVSISLTSCVKTQPCRVFTCNSRRDMAAIGWTYLRSRENFRTPVISLTKQRQIRDAWLQGGKELKFMWNMQVLSTCANYHLV